MIFNEDFRMEFFAEMIFNEAFSQGLFHRDVFHRGFFAGRSVFSTRTACISAV